MLLTLVLTASVVLVAATVLLLLVGRRLRFASRLAGLALAALVAGGGAVLAAFVWNLVPAYALGAAGAIVVACAIATFVVPYWNPVGQLFLGSYCAAAITYLALGAYLTVASHLGPFGLAASILLFALEFLALLISGYFAFEGCDLLCRVRTTRVIAAPDPTYRPRVSLQVPAYNEPADMLIATIKSLEAIDYPNVEILVIDNNTPDPATYEPVARYCESRPGVRFVHIEADGYKAGALNIVMAEHLDPDVEIIGIIDADYLVDPAWLSDLVGYFADPSVAFVQTPQDYREYEGDPYLTSCYDAYRYFFAASMPSRNDRNSIIFAGTMGLIRRAPLQEQGGWPAWCLTEDSETSLRLLKAGYQGIYVDRAYGQGIMPLTFATLKTQRFRWCFGGIQILRRHFADMMPLLPRRRDNRLTAAQRTDYFFGTGLVWFNDMLYLGFTAVLLVTAYLLLAGVGTSFRPLFGALVLLPAALISSGLLRALWSLRQSTGIGLRRSMLALLNWLSLSWTVATATVQGLVRSKAVFMRTPKERDHQTLWTAIRDARTETILALVLWAAGLAVVIVGRAQPFLVVLFAWQGLVYASAPIMSWLNVRMVLPPQLERRRRTELARERASRLAPYYAGATVGAVGLALVVALLVLGGHQPSQPPDLRLPHPPAVEGPTPTPSQPGPPPTPSPGSSPGATTGPGTTGGPGPTPGPGTTTGPGTTGPTSGPGTTPAPGPTTGAGNLTTPAPTGS
jgi:cellulose synthase/poly-beta-1,6-N-acetylglucosamine synthase-like glycosyltransferase